MIGQIRELQLLPSKENIGNEIRREAAQMAKSRKIDCALKLGGKTRQAGGPCRPDRRDSADRYRTAKPCSYNEGVA
ncbi:MULTISPECIES: hypothetical protein [unclassified Paraburkholderia]|uniref:hypothetical protein n=1 Tax=unclassified Paraburkholderia TaxID=2615204 RepID=UPI00161AE85F|nr:MULTISPECIES: hypothetical protein [unclassified Paraburkholderia]MBB5448405.1 hypothetical protein [Paraburkholderia sp. WSM4177]MBB5488786.1 hypothetical protein [Paraburkholderia sp. WSM4180]